MDFISQIRWRPEIGDPTVMGWITVAAYAAAAITALAAAIRAGENKDSGTGTSQRAVWWIVAGLLAALALNKQLDLQSLLTDIGRVLFKQWGWYEERRGFQKLFVLGLLALSALAAAFLAWKFRSFWARHFLLAAGLTFLLTFVVVRAVSFHHVDVFLKSRVVGVKMNWFLELTGIALVWLAAARDVLRPRKEKA